MKRQASSHGGHSSVKWMLPQNLIVNRINKNSSEGKEINNLHCENHFICLRAVCMLFNFKSRGYNKMMKHYHTSPLRTHKGVGNKNSLKGIKSAFKSLHEYFEDFKIHADTFSMKFVHGRTGMETQGNTDSIYLPYYYSKVQLYKTWCFNQGYVVTYKNRALNLMEKVSK